MTSDDERVAELMRFVNDVERAAWLNNAIEQRKAEAAVEAYARALLGAVKEDVGAQSKAMFVARLENMGVPGDTWLTIHAVLALLNDCDMLANRAAMKETK